MNKKREALERQAKKRQGTRTDLNIREKLPKSERPRDIIGKELGVSGRQVDKLHEINKKATPQTKQLVREGKLSINQAFNAVHPKRTDPVKQAKKEHEAFQEQKQKSVVNFRDAQIDKINQRMALNPSVVNLVLEQAEIEEGCNYAPPSTFNKYSCLFLFRSISTTDANLSCASSNPSISAFKYSPL